MARHSKLWPEKGVQVLAKMCSMLRSHWDEFRDVYVDVAPLSTFDMLKCVCVAPTKFTELERSWTLLLRRGVVRDPHRQGMAARPG